MDLWFAASFLRKTPFVCSGLLDDDGVEVTGEWTLACFLPEACACSGGGGTFSLLRLAPG